MRPMRNAAWVLALLSAPALADDWPHLGRDGGRTRAPVESITGTIAPLAAVATGAEAVASPVLADGVLVAAGMDGVVRAFRETDRSLLWTAALGAPVMGTPLADRGRLYVPCTDGTLSVLRIADGATLWTLETGGADRSSPVMAGNTLHLGSGFPNTTVLAVDTVSRSVSWAAPLEQVTDSSPAVSAGKVIAGCNSGRVVALDAATGAEAWSYASGGTLGPSSPVVDGGSVYILSEATFHRVDLDSANWGAANWTLGLTDPAPPTGPTVLGVDWATSSPALAGGLVVFAVRFNYHMNLDADPYGMPDARILREFAFAVDPAARTVRWRALLGQAVVPDVNGIPPYRVSPTPVSTGPAVAFASSVAASLQLLSPADGSALSTFALDAPCLASPVVANARITVLSRAGTLSAFQGANAPPGAVAGMSPSGLELDVAPALLSWNASEPGATYLVRTATDGEVLMDWDTETVVAGTSFAPPPLADGFVHTWAVRPRDAGGAYGPWSAASFGLNVPPSPPLGLTALPRHEKVILGWGASPSPNVVGYRLTYGAATLDLGIVTTATVTGLANGVAVTFELRALDSDNDLSAPAVATATPVSLISIGSASFDSLQAAAAAALPGQTIQLGEDTFSLSGTVNLASGVRLRGVNAFSTRVEAQGAFDVVSAAGGNTVGLLSLSGGSVGVRARGTGVRIANAVIRDMSDAGIVVEGDAEAVNNTLVRNGVAGLRSSGYAAARNNIVQENGVGFAGAVSSSYNDVSDGYSGASPGPGDKASPVAFLDPASGDFRESPMQPSLDAGDPRDPYSLEPGPNGGRVNQGAFGNTSLAATSSAAAAPAASSSGNSCSASVAARPGAASGAALVALLLLFLRRRRGESRAM